MSVQGCLPLLLSTQPFFIPPVALLLLLRPPNALGQIAVSPLVEVFGDAALPPGVVAPTTLPGGYLRGALALSLEVCSASRSLPTPAGATDDLNRQACPHQSHG